ncbi:hypothetical protein ZHAS_00007367 [Anopheles sinensis]|uniref:Uncharacterized protein n=1 Tax=Anopheles sinensis TaxID=74873 RepID=A0A084VPT6_ANOSI|nr:hypothetical protein ZHAS_00007367 [Anopheles sinensis]
MSRVQSSRTNIDLLIVRASSSCSEQPTGQCVSGRLLEPRNGSKEHLTGETRRCVPLNIAPSMQAHTRPVFGTEPWHWGPVKLVPLGQFHIIIAMIVVSVKNCMAETVVRPATHLNAVIGSRWPTMF